MHDQLVQSHVVNGVREWKVSDQGIAVSNVESYTTHKILDLYPFIAGWVNWYYPGGSTSWGSWGSWGSACSRSTWWVS